MNDCLRLLPAKDWRNRHNQQTVRINWLLIIVLGRSPKCNRTRYESRYSCALWRSPYPPRFFSPVSGVINAANTMQHADEIPLGHSGTESPPPMSTIRLASLPTWRPGGKVGRRWISIDRWYGCKWPTIAKQEFIGMRHLHPRGRANTEY